MKKTIFYFTVSLITVGFAGGITPAYAASAPSQAETQAQSTAILKQSLDILENLLTKIESQLQQPGQLAVHKAELISTLGSIGANLAGIHAALANSNSAIAANIPQTSAQTATPAPILAKPEVQQPIAAQAPQTENMDGTVISPSVALSPRDLADIPLAAIEKSADAPLAVPENTDNVTDPSAASISVSSNWKNFLWPSVSLIAILALIFFLRMGEKEELHKAVPSSAKIAALETRAKPARAERAPINMDSMDESPIIY